MTQSRTPTYDRLKAKERAFVDSFIECGFNATEAGKVCKLKDPRRRGYELRTKQDISRAIDERLEESGVTPAMVKCRIAEQAFASMGDVLSFDKKGVARLDLAQARKLRKLHLIAKIKERTYFDKTKQVEVKEIEAENYSAQAALFKLHDHFERPNESKKTIAEFQALLLQYKLNELNKKEALLDLIKRKASPEIYRTILEILSGSDEDDSEEAGDQGEATPKE